MLSIIEEEESYVVDSCAEWVVYSAALYHATPSMEFVTMYKTGDFCKIKMGNSSNADIMEVGDVCIQTNIGCTLTLNNVQHVPDLCLNLISVHALDLAEYHSDFDDGKWKFSKGLMVVARGMVYNTLYKTQVK